MRLWQDGDRMNFKDYAKHFEENILSLQKHSSQVTQKSRLRKLVEAFGDKELPLPSMEVQMFITKLCAKYPPQTVHNIYGTLRTVLASAKNEGIITEVPSPSLPKINREEQGWFTPDQMRALCRYDPMYAVFAETGVRRGEAFALKIGDIDFELRTLSVRRNIYGSVVDIPKSRAGTRTLSVSSWLLGILSTIVGGRPTDKFLFQSDVGEPLNADSETARLYSACRALRIPEEGFHAFRRGNATLQASVIGVPEKIIAYRLGHTNLGLTLGRYAKYLVGMDRDTAEAIGRLLK
jgi:integrase